VKVEGGWRMAKGRERIVDAGGGIEVSYGRGWRMGGG
jgi:hypothetical protein